MAAAYRVVTTADTGVVGVVIIELPVNGLRVETLRRGHVRHGELDVVDAAVGMCEHVRR